MKLLLDENLSCLLLVIRANRAHISKFETNQESLLILRRP
jgi:hypothetical protein